MELHVPLQEFGCNATLISSYIVKKFIDHTHVAMPATEMYSNDTCQKFRDFDCFNCAAL